MKLHILILLILSLSLAVAAQEVATAQPVTNKRVLWTPKKECSPANFTEQERAALHLLCDSYVKDNYNVRLVRYKDILLAVKITYDDYTMADVFVLNNSPDRVLINPERSRVFYWKNGDPDKDKSEVFLPISPEKIASKIKNRVMWANILGGIAASMQTRTTTSNSSTTGSASVYDNRGNSANGIYNGTTTSTTTTPDTAAQIESGRQNNRRTQGAQILSDSIVGNALKANTLFTNQSANGLIYFPHKKAKLALFSIILDDVYFDFAFTF